MARNNLELSRGLNGSGGKSCRTTGSSYIKHSGSSPKYFKSISPPMKQQHQSKEMSPQRLSPQIRVMTSPSTSPRTSPGLLAGHYASCKFTEPPLPSALPLPPQHWMQSSHVVLRPFDSKQEPEQLTRQLKVLLKVQA